MMKKKVMFFIFFIACIITPNVYAKYIMQERIEIVNIEKVDLDKPYINNRNYDVDYEDFNTDVEINYYDNLKVKYAKYWFNEKEIRFDGDGINFDSGMIFAKSGFYKVEVCDMYENKTNYSFIIDKEVNSAYIECSNISDKGGNLVLKAEDNVSGIQKIDFYINNNLYKTFSYEEKFTKNKIEELFVDIDNLPFYEECYIVATDFYGNTLESNKIIPNKNRIYDLQDFIKFRDVINTGITNFKNQGIYLLNDIDLSSVCSSSKESWIPIGTSEKIFSGVFEGNNHDISNLYINLNTAYSGLFSTVSGTIQNLNLNGIVINAGDYSGSFVGYLINGEIKNCKNNVKITATTSNIIGGIVGIIEESTKVTYCINYANVFSNNFAGGIVRI